MKLISAKLYFRKMTKAKYRRLGWDTSSWEYHTNKFRIGFVILILILIIYRLLEKSNTTEEEEENVKYLLDTQGCKIRRFNLTDRTIAFYRGFTKPVKCVDKPYLIENDFKYLWTTYNASILKEYYEVDVPTKFSCSYRAVNRTNDNSIALNTEAHKIPVGQYIRVYDEFVVVRCRYKNKIIYKDFFLFPPQIQTKFESQRSENEMNVLVIGISAISLLNKNRQIPKTIHFLLDTLNAIEMHGYTKLEEDSHTNNIAVLTGLFPKELSKTCLMETNSTYDNCAIIFREYKNRHYINSFAEDSGTPGIFDYQTNGFHQPPTDYYLPPSIFYAVDNQTKEQPNKMCLFNRRKSINVILSYLKKTLILANSNKQFGVFWTDNYDPEKLRKIESLDAIYLELFQYLLKHNVFNNTFVIITSSNGIRFGNINGVTQEFLDDRMSMLYLIPPNWFTKKYPEAYVNLKSNRKSLTTPFDLHATLRHLVSLHKIDDDEIKKTGSRLDQDPLPRGISLLLPVPKRRNCFDAVISSQLCTCYVKKSSISKSSDLPMVGRHAVYLINTKLLSHPRCSKLGLSKIEDAIDLESSSRNSDDKIKYRELVLTFATKPGNGIFEASFSLQIDNGQVVDITETSEISRLNKFELQNSCTNDPYLKPFCHCRK